MLDFVLFFLIFIPSLDAFRAMRGMQQTKKLMLSGLVTSLIGSYFMYNGILLGKKIDQLVSNHSYLSLDKPRLGKIDHVGHFDTLIFTVIVVLT